VEQHTTRKKINVEHTTDSIQNKDDRTLQTFQTDKRVNDTFHKKAVMLRTKAAGFLYNTEIMM
jgi:hypothetical protein